MPYLVTARFGFMRTLGDFVTEDATLARRDWAILRTHRGTEIGDVLLASREAASEEAEATRGQVVRRASADDLAKREAIERDLAVKEFTACRRLARELSLPMKVVSVEHLFGGERLVFYFTSEGRVDFRRLVRELGRTFKTRVEMRQIGARDEARLLGDVGHCGLTLCCRSFLRELQPVTMRMARSQKATLDPGKISGACGRLMCCLRYEDETYRTLKKTMPPLGAVFAVAEGQAEVTGHEILARRCVLTLEGGQRVVKRVEELPESLRRRDAEQNVGKEGPDGRPRRRGRGGRGRRRLAPTRKGRQAERSTESDGRGPKAPTKPPAPNDRAAAGGAAQEGSSPPGRRRKGGPEGDRRASGQSAGEERGERRRRGRRRRGARRRTATDAEPGPREDGPREDGDGADGGSDRTGNEATKRRGDAGDRPGESKGEEA